MSSVTSVTGRRAFLPIAGLGEHTLKGSHYSLKAHFTDLNLHAALSPSEVIHTIEAQKTQQKPLYRATHHVMRETGQYGSRYANIRTYTHTKTWHTVAYYGLENDVINLVFKQFQQRVH